MALPNVIPLRKNGPLVDKLPWPPDESNDPPRSLTSLARIVDGGLCHRCGSCVGICPTIALGLDKQEYPIVSDLSACTDCNLCVRVCPGSEFPANRAAKSILGTIPPCEDMHGFFHRAYLSYAEDPQVRERSTSGGLITGLLISLLEQKLIDGAIVVSSDEKEPWKGRPTVARSPEEVLSATKSKYAISPTNIMLAEVRKTPGRYAVVGLPCQIHGLYKAAELDPRIKERVVLTIGLFCHAAVEHEPMEIIWEGLGYEKDEIARFLSRVGKHPGTPHVELKDGSLHPVYFPKAKGYRPSSMEILNILYRLYTPARCLTCYDSTAEFADIAVGDPWMAPPSDDIDFLQGYSFALARTERGIKALSKAKDAGGIALIDLDESLARRSNRMMGTEKRGRAFRVIETLRRQGRPIPEYGFTIPRGSGIDFLKTEMNILSHIFCFVRSDWANRMRPYLLKVSLSPLGYALLWLNAQRRRLRDAIRDMRAKRRRKTGTN